MNATGKRLGFALLFTVAAVTFNVYAVLNGSAETFYEDVTRILLRGDTRIADAYQAPGRQLQDEDCHLFASGTAVHLAAASLSRVKCNEQIAIGI